jgi:phage gp36-like protein
VYCTPNDVRYALAPLFEPADDGTWPTTNTAADLTDDQLADAIVEADSELNSYISRYYVTPVANVEGRPPVAVKAISRNIAAYNATLTWRRGKDLTDADPVVRRWRATMDLLTAVRDGKQILEGVPPNVGPTAASGAGQTVNQYVGRMFGLDDFSLGYGFPRSFPHYPNGTW